MIQLAHPAMNALKWTLEHSASHHRVNSSLAVRIGSISGLKTFPVVAQKVISLLSKSDFTIDEITDTIRHDPSLAAGVLRLANSPFYMATHPITSLDMALVRLGRNTVREVIFAVATMQLFPDTHGLGRLVRDHCATVAALAHALSNRFRVGTPEVMFLAGLMHDIGIMLLIDSGEVMYTFSRNDARVNPDGFRDTELDQIGFDHAILGAQVLSRWKVGAPIPQLVAYHHLPEFADKTPEIASMMMLLRLADALELYLNSKDASPGGFLAQERVRTEGHLLNINDSQWEPFWQDLVDTHTQAKQLFS